MAIDMKSFARVGAQARLTELAAEIDAIRSEFPELGTPGSKRSGRRTGSTVGGSRQPKTSARQSGTAPTGGRKPMSAAAKRAVAERMRSYWAARKAGASGSTEAAAPVAKSSPSPKGPTKRTMSAEARAKISAAQKKRWATQKRAAKRARS
jgi:hypothetical protein